MQQPEFDFCDDSSQLSARFVRGYYSAPSSTKWDARAIFSDRGFGSWGSSCHICYLCICSHAPTPPALFVADILGIRAAVEKYSVTLQDLAEAKDTVRGSYLPKG
jgi:hypothetical protein